MLKTKMTGVLLGFALSLGTSGARAEDWPQFRGPNRDANASGFTAPKTWPKELTKKWKVTVGEGLATPSLVGDKLYVFSAQSGNDVIRCLDAATGKELWKDSYESERLRGMAAGRGGEFAGPRCSPAVADGKVVTLGPHGILSCYDAASGKKLWRKDDIKGVPKFYTASSPMIVSGLCIAQLGGSTGVVAAYDLNTGAEKWKWSGEGTTYASPVLFTMGDTKVVVAETMENIVGISMADGKQLWKTPFPVGGRGGRPMGGGGRPGGGGGFGGGMGYNASTPMVFGQTVIYSGSNRGTKAVKIEKDSSGFAAKEAWANKDNSVQFNSPVVANGLVFGLSGRDTLFCLNAKDGKTAWTKTIGGGRRGYGNIIAAGSVMMVLMPNSQLTVFEPSDKEFKEIASYKVAETDSFAYPVVAGKRVFVKDRDSVILWTID